MKGPATVLVGGFGFSGVPNTLINAVRDRPDIKDLTVVSNNAGMPGAGLGTWPSTLSGVCIAFEMFTNSIARDRPIARVQADQ